MSGHTIHHFGPDPRTVGGMAAVIRTLAEHHIGGEAVEAHPTWRPDSRVAGAGLAAVAAQTLWRAPSSHVAHFHFAERGSFVREGVLLALAQSHGLVTVATIHGAQFAPFARRNPRLVSGVLSRAQLVTCLEAEALDLVARLAPLVHREIVPNPVLVEASPPPADETDELVLFAGEIGLRKGVDVLHRAWPLIAQRRPRAQCLIVGPSGDFDPPALERLKVLPAVAPDELSRLMRRARVIALPARAEAMPMVLTEAMSMARPFVGTPVGGVPDLAAGGMLVDVNDAAGLADRLTDLLSDPKLARSIGERGHRLVARTRSVEIIDERLRRLYDGASAARAQTR